MGNDEHATNCALGVRTTKSAAGRGLSRKSSTAFLYSSVNSNLPHFSGFSFNDFCTKLPMYSNRRSTGPSGAAISVSNDANGKRQLYKEASAFLFVKGNRRNFHGTYQGVGGVENMQRIDAAVEGVWSSRCKNCQSFGGRRATGPGHQAPTEPRRNTFLALADCVFEAGMSRLPRYCYRTHGIFLGTTDIARDPVFRVLAGTILLFNARWQGRRSRASASGGGRLSRVLFSSFGGYFGVVEVESPMKVIEVYRRRLENERFHCG